MEVKKRQIINTSKGLFSKFGIRRVTIEEICSEAKVSKGTFYKHFKNKTDLILILLEDWTSDGLRRYRKIMDCDCSFREKVEKIIKLKMEQTREISLEFIEDLMQNSGPEVIQYHRTKALENLQIVTQDFSEAQKRGDIRQDIKIEFILYFFNHMFDMMKDPQLLHMYATPGELINELMNFMFYGILKDGGRRPETGG